MKKILTLFGVLCIVYGASAQYRVESLAWQTIDLNNGLNPEAKPIYRSAGFMQQVSATQKAVDLNLQAERTKTKGGFGRGAWIGAVIGTGLGIITGLIVGNDSCYPNCLFGGSTGDNVLIYGTTGAFSGALIGGIVGAITKKRK
jgi:hypothetical protein